MSSFDPNQRRGHPSNPGRWSAHEHTAPETGLARQVAPTPPDTIPGEVAASGEADLGGFGTFETYCEEVVVGDAVYAAGDGDEYKFVGRAVHVGPHPSKDGMVRISFAGGAGLVGDPSDKIAVVRDEFPPRYDGDGDHWTQVGNIYHPAQPAEVLDRVAAEQAEDDFLLAVALHPNASPAALEIAAKHSSFAVRDAVAKHPATSVATLTGLLYRTEQDREDAARRAVGVSPMQRHHQWERDRAGELASNVARAIERRAAAAV